MSVPSKNVRRSFDRQEIAKLLPYGAAFLFIESALYLDDRQIATTFYWDEKRAEISAHFETRAKIVPGIFLIEQAAQSALLLAILEDRQMPRDPMMLCQIRCDIVASAFAPCQVTAYVSIDGIVMDKIGFRGLCSVDGDTVAKIRGIAAPMPTLYSDT